MEVGRASGLVVLVTLVALLAACSGQDSDPEGALRTNVETFYAAYYGDDPDFSLAATFIAERCPTARGRATFDFRISPGPGGDAAVEIGEISMLDDEHAFVTPSRGGWIGMREAWLVEDGRWRTALQCNAYQDEMHQADVSRSRAAALGDRLEIGDVAVRIDSIRLEPGPGDGVFTASAKVLVVIGYEFENHGREPSSPVGTISLRVLDGSGDRLSPEPLPFEQTEPGFSEMHETRWGIADGVTEIHLFVDWGTWSDPPSAEVIPHHIAVLRSELPVYAD